MLIVILLMGFTFLVDACFGFGAGLVAVPFLSLVMHPRDAVFLMLVFQCLKSVLLIPVWRHINWNILKLMPPGILIGAFLGTKILDMVDADMLRLFLAVYLIIFVASDYLKLAVHRPVNGYVGSMFAGLSGGIISGITGMGGPALVTYLRSAGLNKESFRATVMLALTIVNYFRLSLDFEEIIRSPALLEYLGPCLLVFAVAAFFGSRLPKFLSEKTFKTCINLILLVSAVMLLCRNFL